MARDADVTIRRARPEDAAAMAALTDELNRHQREPTGHTTTATILRDGFGHEPQFDAFVAVLDGTVVGYAAMTASYATQFAQRGFYLSDLHVTAAARRRGIGRALMAACAAHARDHGRSFVWWCSKPWNKDAHAFYEALGARIEEVRAHVIHGEAFVKLATGSGQTSAKRSRTTG